MTDRLTPERFAEITALLAAQMPEEYERGKFSQWATDLTNAADDLFAEIEVLRAQIKKAINAFCSCGGAGPGEGCIACDIYHAVFNPEMRP